MTLFQIFLPAFMIVYFFQVFVIRSYVQWKKTGQNPFVFSRSGNAHDYIGFVFKIMTAVSVTVIVLFSFFKDIYLEFLGPLTYLDFDELKWTGVGLLVFSLIWTIVAQYQMSNSWRIGIDYEERTTLVSEGIFKLSRNPVFLGVLLIYLGTFLIAPNAITLTLFVLCYFILQIQTRLEEEYLEKIHGQDYIEYKKKVRRWI
ncbi:MAG: isoprenylcysteine carboxylmethyltransferase family protein [Crocinitomicaceae bacterium]|nr:isoprenylcysteine carboxylmethyltransferase family protein [Crocinitomicaceae bacterium]